MSVSAFKSQKAELGKKNGKKKGSTLIEMINGRQHGMGNVFWEEKRPGKVGDTEVSAETVARWSSKR